MPIFQRLRKLVPELHAAKVSDKHIAGIPDFLLWAVGTSRGLETKFFKGFPKTDRGKILTHNFKPKQVTFLNHMEKTANKGYGAIYCKENNFIYVVSVTNIPESGNWTHGEFKAAVKAGHFKVFVKDEVEDMLNYLFE